MSMSLSGLSIVESTQSPLHVDGLHGFKETILDRL